MDTYKHFCGQLGMTLYEHTILLINETQIEKQIGEVWKIMWLHAVIKTFSFYLTDAVGIMKTTMESNATELFYYDRTQAIEILRLKDNTGAR